MPEPVGVGGETLEQYMARRITGVIDQAVNTVTEATQGRYEHLVVLLRMRSEVNQRIAAEQKRLKESGG